LENSEGKRRSRCAIELKSHIESILGVLAEFKARREEELHEPGHCERLAGFLAELLDISQVMSYFLTMFSLLTLEFVDYSRVSATYGRRTNTLKTRRKFGLGFDEAWVSLLPLANWSKVGLKIAESPSPFGATPELPEWSLHASSAASMCPVLALAPGPRACSRPVCHRVVKHHTLHGLCTGRFGK
jgi:ribosomal RNA methyltransferase Nop2